jgi:hypothetical protein
VVVNVQAHRLLSPLPLLGERAGVRASLANKLCLPFYVAPLALIHEFTSSCTPETKQLGRKINVEVAS